MLRCLSVILILLLVPWASAQLSSGSVGNVRVKLVYSDGRACSIQAHVQLMGDAGSTRVLEGFTDDGCTIEFNAVRVGMYHVVVSGEGIESADSGAFELDSRKVTQSLEVVVTRVSETNAVVPTNPHGHTVAAEDLNIPRDARKEFDKASDFMAKENWKKAVEHLNKALVIYPKYAEAYNNLGVIRGKLGDRPGEREALQKAVSLNDHLAPAYVNLAKMAIADHALPDAETLLNKATAADPSDAQTLVLLANVELLNQHLDAAIANCRKVHAMSQNSHALAHYVAGRALEHENHPKEAVVEFRMFLQEEPSGPRADAVRKEMGSLQAQIQ